MELLHDAFFEIITYLLSQTFLITSLFFLRRRYRKQISLRVVDYEKSPAIWLLLEIFGWGFALFFIVASIRFSETRGIIMISLLFLHSYAFWHALRKGATLEYEMRVPILRMPRQKLSVIYKPFVLALGAVALMFLLPLFY